MSLDQKKFAFLTGAIAASIVVVGVGAAGCSSDSSDGGDKTPNDDASTSNSADSSTGADSSSPTDAGNTETDAADSATVTCLGDDGPAPNCEDYSADCLQSLPWTFCDAYAEIFRPEVALQALSCIESSPSCEGGLVTCTQGLAKQACAVDAKALCDTVRANASCGDNFKQSECEAFVPLLSEAGLKGLETCISSYGCDTTSCYSPADPLLLIDTTSE